MMQPEVPYPPRSDGGEISLTRSLADFAARLRLEAVPAQVVRRMKLHIIDTLGCAVAGWDLDLSEAARRVARSTGQGGHCRVFGTDERFSATAAVFANSVIANALDYDDGFEIDGKGMGHPGASIITAALAAADGANASGAAFLEAVIAGYEVNNRLIWAMQPSAERFAEVYGVGQHQSIGAAIAHARLCGLDGPEIANAIGLAATLTPVPSLHKYNWHDRPIASLKDCVAPAAQAGVLAVIMSRAGLVGAVDVLDGPQGFWRMLGSDRFDPDLALQGLGREWLGSRGSFKVYPACRWMASALEAFEAAFVRSGVRAHDIESIEIASFSAIAEKMMVRRPLDAVDAEFSLPFCIGAIATGRAAGRAWFTADAFADQALLDVADRVHVAVDPAMDRAMNGAGRRPSAHAVIVCADGRRHEHRVDAPLGGGLRPVPDEMIRRKFIGNLGGNPAVAEPLAAMIDDLEDLPDIAPMLDLLYGARR